MAISFDLQKHDAQFHPNGFDPAKGSCKFRERIKDYESVDTLEGDMQELTDALEDLEVLEGLMANAPDDAKERIKKMIDDTEAIIKKGGKASNKNAAGSATNVAAQPVTQFGPKPVIPHDTKAFPDKNDSSWQDALANYGDSSYGWHSAGSGSTRPHYIDFGGKRYFVKKAGVNSTYDKAAARNEANANNFLRLAGLNAPDSMYLKSDDGGRFCITSAVDLSGGQLERKLGSIPIAQEVREAYPIMSLLYNMDIMQNADNAFVDKDGEVVFLDNGSTFGFSAQGERNKRFNFDKRNDPVNSSPDFVALANFHGNKSGSNWREAITGSSSKDVDLETALKLAAKYEMGALVKEADKLGYLKQLPKEGKAALQAYADKLDQLSAKYKQPKATTSVQAVGQANGQPVQPPVESTTTATLSEPKTSAAPANNPQPANNGSQTFDYWKKQNENAFSAYFNDSNNAQFVDNADYEMKVKPTEFKNATMAVLYNKGVDPSNGTIPQMDEKTYEEVMTHIASGGGATKISDFSKCDEVVMPDGSVGYIYDVFPQGFLTAYSTNNSRELQKFSPTYQPYCRPLSWLVKRGGFTNGKWQPTPNNQATTATPVTSATTGTSQSGVPMPSAKATQHWLLGHKKVWEESYDDLKKEVQARGFSDDDEELAEALGKVSPINIAGGHLTNGQMGKHHLTKEGYDALVGYLKPKAIVAATSQTGAATGNKTSSSAAQRLQAMMTNPNASAAQKAAYQTMLNRLNGGSVAPSASTTSTHTPAQTQTVQASAPKQTAQPTKVATTNPKYKNTLMRLIALKNRAGATPSQQAAYQAMIDRLNNSAV